jgi:hypothetical protein
MHRRATPLQKRPADARTHMQGLLDDNFEIVELYFIITHKLLVQLHVSFQTSHGILLPIDTWWHFSFSIQCVQMSVESS